MGTRRPTSTDDDRRPGRRLPAACAPAALALLGLLAYIGTVGAPFIYDDHNAIVENPHVRSLWPLSEAMSAPDESTVAGRPVAALSLALNHAASGLEPWSYHLVNILIHLLCALTLYGIVRRTLATPRIASLGAAPSDGWAFAVTLVWLLHPLHTEVVTYISTRTESLVGLFYLASLYAVIRGSSNGRHASRWYAAAVAASALAMGSKEVAVTLPIVVLLYDGIFLSEGFAAALARRRGLYAGLAATWLILIALVAASPRGETVGLHFADLTPLDYARTQVAVIWHYLRLAVWPHPLALDYFDWPVAHGFSAGVWLGLLPLLALVLGSLLLIARRSWIGFLGGWFFAILAPSSSVVPIASELAAERRMYLPLAAVVALALTGLWLAATRAAGSRGATVFAAAAAAIALALGALTADRNRDYRDEITIWQQTVLRRPSNVRALQNLGAALAHNGRPQEAVPFLERALAIDPYAEYALENLGLIRLEEGRSSEAVALLSRRLERRPDDGISHLNLAKALLATGDSAGALAALEEAVRLLPDNGLAHARLGLVLADQGRLKEAAAHGERGVALDPDNPAVRLAAGRIELRRGMPESAVRHYRVALERDPGELEATLGLAVALERSGHAGEGAATFERVAAGEPSIQRLVPLAASASVNVDAAAGIGLLRAATRLRPDDPELQLALGRVLAVDHRSAEALACYRRALELQPRSADAANSLALLLATADDPAVRDPQAALSLARELSGATGGRHPVLLGTLGVALASAGERAAAEKALAGAAAIAREAGHPELAASLDRQLVQVQQGWPPPPGARTGR
jgi:tetratricopeptide (TPR) repeat protein